jgi:hypothetical protein
MPAKDGHGYPEAETRPLMSLCGDKGYTQVSADRRVNTAAIVRDCDP